MELIKELKTFIDVTKSLDKDYDTENCRLLVTAFSILQDLCDGAGETQWSIKDQINLAIEELKY